MKKLEMYCWDEYEKNLKINDIENKKINYKVDNKARNFP